MRPAGRARPILALMAVLLVLAAAPALRAEVAGAAQAASAAPAGGQAPGQWSPAGYPGPQIPWARVVSGTLAVAALACFGVWLLKKLNGGGAPGRQRYLEVIEARSVGRNVQLLLVRAAGKVLLLACGGGTVTRVAEFAEGELPEPEGMQGPGSLEGFKSLWQRMVGAPE